MNELSGGKKRVRRWMSTVGGEKRVRRWMSTVGEEEGEEVDEHNRGTKL